ncbi:hypothetical protein AB1Y20_000066 [Prymnesium parvum]|uniref:PDZ domain-containing protein n=1 Tax=Prymnesium parvum TaxID=97485 RepID=A0AB34K7X3_PRYPA
MAASGGDDGAALSSRRLPSSATPMMLTITVHMGHERSLGIELDDDNAVVAMADDSVAASFGMCVGDVVVEWQGTPLDGVRLGDRMRPAPIHVLRIARGGRSCTRTLLSTARVEAQPTAVSSAPGDDNAQMHAAPLSGAGPSARAPPVPEAVGTKTREGKAAKGKGKRRVKGGSGGEALAARSAPPLTLSLEQISLLEQEAAEAHARFVQLLYQLEREVARPLSLEEMQRHEELAQRKERNERLQRYLCEVRDHMRLHMEASSSSPAPNVHSRSILSSAEPPRSAAADGHRARADPPSQSGRDARDGEGSWVDGAAEEQMGEGHTLHLAWGFISEIARDFSEGKPAFAIRCTHPTFTASLSIVAFTPWLLRYCLQSSRAGDEPADWMGMPVPRGPADQPPPGSLQATWSAVASALVKQLGLDDEAVDSPALPMPHTAAQQASRTTRSTTPVSSPESLSQPALGEAAGPQHRSKAPSSGDAERPRLPPMRADCPPHGAASSDAPSTSPMLREIVTLVRAALQQAEASSPRWEMVEVHLVRAVELAAQACEMRPGGDVRHAAAALRRRQRLQLALQATRGIVQRGLTPHEQRGLVGLLKVFLADEGTPAQLAEAAAPGLSSGQPARHAERPSPPRELAAPPPPHAGQVHPFAAGGKFAHLATTALPAGAAISRDVDEESAGGKSSEGAAVPVSEQGFGSSLSEMLSGRHTSNPRADNPFTALRARIPVVGGWRGPFDDDDDDLDLLNGDDGVPSNSDSETESGSIWKNFSMGLGLVTEARDKALNEFESATESVRKSSTAMHPPASTYEAVTRYSYHSSQRMVGMGNTPANDNSSSRQLKPRDPPRSDSKPATPAPQVTEPAAPRVASVFDSLPAGLFADPNSAAPEKVSERQLLGRQKGREYSYHFC